MSSLAGFYSLRDGRVGAPADTLRRMRESMSHRGTLSESTWSDDRDGLTAAGHDWGEDDVYHRGSLAIACDARLEGRSAIESRLGRNGAGTGELLGAAYETWGPTWVGELEGPFALAVVDGDDLLLARDPTGRRPLFYARSPEAIFFASEIKAFFLGAGLEPAPNQALIADHLWGRITRGDETFFEGVMRVPPGHVLRFRRTGERVDTPYHVLASGVPVGGESPAAEDVQRITREHLCDAVGAELVPDASCGLTLSSGVDSTSVLSVCPEALGGSGRDLGDLTVVSSYFGRIAASDERGQIEAIAALYGVEPVFLRSDDCWACKDLEDAPRIRLDEPLRGQLLDAFEVLQISAARDRSADLLLTGYGGDEVWTASLWRLRDLQDRGAADELERELSRLPDTRRQLARSLLDSGSKPLDLAEATGELGGHLSASWEIHRSRLAHADLPDVARFPSFGAWEEHARATGFYSAALAEIIHGIGLQFGVRIGLPFLHPRFVEFCLAVDGEHKLHDGFTKNLARCALQGFAPPSLVERREKTHLAGLVDRGLRFRERAVVEELLDVESPGLDLVPREYRLSVYEYYRNGDPAARNVLLKILGLCIWSRQWFT